MRRESIVQVIGIVVLLATIAVAIAAVYYEISHL
jgi:hypothetical protein